MREALAPQEACYIDPAPASVLDFTRDALDAVNGGEAITVIVTTCGQTFGVITVVTVGDAIVSIVE